MASKYADPSSVLVLGISKREDSPGANTPLSENKSPLSGYSSHCSLQRYDIYPAHVPVPRMGYHGVQCGWYHAFQSMYEYHAIVRQGTCLLYSTKYGVPCNNAASTMSSTTQYGVPSLLKIQVASTQAIGKSRPRVKFEVGSLALHRRILSWLRADFIILSNYFKAGICDFVSIVIKVDIFLVISRQYIFICIIYICIYEVDRCP